MGWISELVVSTIAEVFGYQVGRGKPWWVELLATLVCLLTLGLTALLLLWLVR